jgi:hypothetical protein
MRNTLGGTRSRLCLVTLSLAGVIGGCSSSFDSPVGGTGTKDPSSSSDVPVPVAPPGTPGPSGGTTSGAGTGGGGGTIGTAPSSGSAGTVGAGAPSSPPGSSPPGPTVAPQAGLLTAGTWDDNQNYDFYRQYHQRQSTSQSPGLPVVSISDRMVVLVTDSVGVPVAGARVVVTADQREVGHTQTGGDGRALFFPSSSGVAAGSALAIVAEADGVQNTTAARAGDVLVTVPLGVGASPVTGLDLAILIDTTGSMDDEIRYLESELLSIASAVKELYPAVSQRWAYVAYRDYSDVYVTKKSDFVADVRVFRDSFATLDADGGGDLPEAPERGLADLDTLTWRNGAVARVAFWVGDAPHHAEHAAEVTSAIRAAHARGIHLYPVASSGTDELLEFSMRLSALVTGGRYLFLTNDSGIGGDHKEPTIPCYVVTSLQKAMLRMIRMELTGAPLDPDTADVIRTSGDPHDGRCTLTDGEQVDLL